MRKDLTIVVVFAAISSVYGADPKTRPAIPGFGEPPKSTKTGPTPVLGFGPAAVPVVALEKRYDSRVIEYVERMLRDYDKNKDDVLDAEEMKSVRWSNDPKESDLDGDGQLSKAELCERIAKRWSRESAQRAASDSARSSGTGSSASAQYSEEYQKVRRYAEGLLKQYDANHNGVLEKDEWSQMRSGTRDADTNGDGVITLDELTAKLSSYGKDSSSSSSSSGGSSSSPPSGTSASTSSSPSSGSRPSFSGGSFGSSRSRSGNDPKKTGRFLTPTERLPKGLPDWFLRSDADGDGQIAMAEYTTTWNDAKAEEFAKFDLDGDGLITPQECLNAEKKSAEKKPSR